MLMRAIISAAGLSNGAVFLVLSYTVATRAVTLSDAVILEITYEYMVSMESHLAFPPFHGRTKKLSINFASYRSPTGEIRTISSVHSIRRVQMEQ